MNRPLISFILIAIAVAIGIFSLIYIDKTHETITVMADEIIESASEDNRAHTMTLLEKTDKQWDKSKKILNILIGQQSTNEVKTAIRMAMHFAKLGDMESVILYSNEFKVEMEKIKETNEPSWSTIL